MKQTLPLLALLCLHFNLLQAQVWTTTEMPTPLCFAGFATHGNKLIILGGANTDFNFDPNAASDKIYTYDTETGEWSEQPLANPRIQMQGLVIGGKLMFAGGFGWWNNGDPTVSDVVDVYDTLTGAWSIEHLSNPRRNVAAAAVAGKAYFAGGRTSGNVFSDRLDIYDPATGEWTTDTIPGAGNCHAGVAGDKLLLWSEANCYTLNTLTGEWETVNFTFTRGFARSVVATPEEVWFIGGLGYLDTIDIYNIADGTWRFENMAVPRGSSLACYLNGKIIIAGGSDGSAISALVETFDTQTGEWLDLAELSEPRYAATSGNYLAPVIGNKAFFPGGSKFMDFSAHSDKLDIYTDTSGMTSGLLAPVLKNGTIQSFPSPFSEALHVQVDFEKPTSGSLEVYDLAGRQVFLENIDRQQVWNKTITAQGWSAGAFLLKVRTADGVAIRKILKQ